MNSHTYQQRRGQIETYFDRTAVQAWAQLTSDAPVSGVRATVRAGRDRMRATLLSWLPSDMHGLRVLDAGCGTGALSQAMALRGAQVLGVDLSPNLIRLAQERVPTDAIAAAGGHIEWRDGDMLDPAFGDFDYVVAMDSLIHYQAPDVVRALSTLARRTRRALLCTYAPSSPALQAMHAVGKLFPRADRSPAIVPVRRPVLESLCADDPVLRSWRAERTQRVASGFYTSEAMERVLT
jgi:magnesium-protoporphyrin O-methyltransferase